MNMLDIQKSLNGRGFGVVFVDYGIAYRIDETIFLNKNLVKYPSILKPILDHEIRHTSKFTLRDFNMDLFEGDIFTTLLFCFRHPKAFTHFIPISFYNRELVVDVNTIIIYGLIIGLLALFFSL